MRPSTDVPPDSMVDLPCACATVRRAARVVAQLYDGHLRATEIEGMQFALLSVLSSLGPCHQAAIDERFGLDKTTLSRNLKLLKNKGWIEAAETADGREWRYVLTTAGGKRLAAATEIDRLAQNLGKSMDRRIFIGIYRLRSLVRAAAVNRRVAGSNPA